MFPLSTKDMAVNLNRVADGLEELNENLNHIIDLVELLIEESEPSDKMKAMKKKRVNK